jgi:uncharacterized membrane protein
MRNGVKILAAAIGVVAVVILVYALLTPQNDTSSTDRMGMFGNHTSYSSGNVGLIAISSAMFVLALMIIILWQEYEPLPPNLKPVSSPKVETRGTPEVVAESIAQPHRLDEDEVMAREYLVLRLLSGDERTMFKAIMDSGGEALQKDLILRTKMSNAKVSRLLDRLLQKGVITKERHGATNKVRVKPE